MQILKNIFPSYFYDYLQKTPLDKVNEIRLRNNKKVVVTISNKSYYLSQNGLTGDTQKALNCDKDLINDILKRACENSVYAYSNQIKNGFITTSGGIRIGLSGEGVYEKNYLKTLKNINSLVVRIPHQILGCSNNSHSPVVLSAPEGLRGLEVHLVAVLPPLYDLSDFFFLGPAPVR